MCLGISTDDFLIAPSLLSADFARLAEEVAAVEAAGADWLHVDVMDGHFVPNLTIGAPVVKSLKAVATKPLDVHLMIDTPERYVADFHKAGAAYLTIHVEATKDPSAVLKDIRQRGMKAGITLRPATPLGAIEPFLSMVDLVLVMTVNPGFGGQSFMADQVEKIRQLRAWRDEKSFSYLIEVDGGINAETAPLCADADVLVAGSFVFKQDYAAAIRTLKKSKSIAREQM